MLGISAHDHGRRTLAPRSARSQTVPGWRRPALTCALLAAALALPGVAQEVNLPDVGPSLDGAQLAQTNPAEQIPQLLDLARQLLDAGQFDQAIAAAEQVFQIEVDNPDLRLKEGMLAKVAVTTESPPGALTAQRVRREASPPNKNAN